MVKINIREFAHNLSYYLKEVKSGQRVIIMERNKAIADIIPHHEHVMPPGWQRPITKVKVKGETFAETIRKERDQGR